VSGAPFDPAAHWENVYRSKPVDQVSWFEETPAHSMAMLERAGALHSDPIIDVGGGASRFADHLLDRGYRDVTVLDISAAALERSQARLGERASLVRWTVGDARSFRPATPYRFWHDRVVLHFLTAPEDQKAYRESITSAVAPGGHAAIATFASDGPSKCSGLEVCRHDVNSITALLGPALTIIHDERATHLTPWGAEQRFHWFLLKRA